MSAVLSPVAPTGRFDQATLDDVRSREPLSNIFERFGHKIRRAGRVHECLCPFHAERTPSCTIDDAKGVFFCHGCSAGGDLIDAVMRFRGCEFPDAVEFLGGARELSEFDRARLDKQRRDREAEAAAERRRTSMSVERLLADCRAYAGTHAEAYLGARGLAPSASQTRDLRFHPGLTYRGFATPTSQETEPLGIYPAMIGVIRDAVGVVIGLHRTYLDPVEPRKMTVPGDTKRNRAKKILGEHRGGSIALSLPSPRMAYGEGIETVLSWRALGHGIDEGYGLASTVSLGNMSGSATGTLPHPTRERDGRPLPIPNGIPDLERPGFVPGPDVIDAVLLGDGDSEAISTRMRLLTAARRYAVGGRSVGVHMAPDGEDFNDALLRDLA
ncbi:DUF7146 domain-containing protein [Methylobacterium aquaticum]|uniref:DUF7146 domain-containing protein n=1 Tax=Methylobacterium aquaticum TaxID=270351 RepID=UPI003D1828D0